MSNYLNPYNYDSDEDYYEAQEEAYKRTSKLYGGNPDIPTYIEDAWKEDYYERKYGGYDEYTGDRAGHQ